MKQHVATGALAVAAFLMLSACETFHYGDKIRYRGAEVALLNWDGKVEQGKEISDDKARETARNTKLYRLDGKLYERATLTYAPITHVAAWHRWFCMGSIGYNYSSEETVGEPTERREIMVQVYPASNNAPSPYIPADEFDFARATVVKASEMENSELCLLENSLYLEPRGVPPLGQPDNLRDYMADLPARKVHPLNYIAGGIVHLAVDWPLNIIVNIINPLDVWHFPESWR